MDESTETLRPAPIGRQVSAAECVLPCRELDPALSFFTDTLGFRIDTIHPADDPSVAVVSGHGLRIRLERSDETPAGRIRLACGDLESTLRKLDGTTELVAPNGTRIELVDAHPAVSVPETRSRLVISRDDGDGAWGTGRAGMLYRDLIPDRLGGSFIASHIRIPNGGPVPDYVHFHRIHFQMIYSYRGWARLVYEDQGPPFILNAGDCVLQPPEIRHRVLECSDGMEVIEIGCPAVHETFADHELALPTDTISPERSFGGQRFVRHHAAKAKWSPYRVEGFEQRDIGIGDATDGLAGVRVARVKGTPAPVSWRHDAPFLFHFVLEGALGLATQDGVEELRAGDSFVLPPGDAFGFRDGSSDLELLEVSLPATFKTELEAS